MSDFVPSALPELLAPAGSKESLLAALAGGAKAVYLGGPSFHARMHASPFSEEDLKEAVFLCRSRDVRLYVTLNTLVFDREIRDWLAAALFCREIGVDALITDDIGAASELHRIAPDMPLHASTQMSVHSSSAGELLKEAGFSRMVVARETTRENLLSLCRHSGLEIEAFIHGALCVCHSGQCLFSSLVGGRSGNRGDCAQPCRLPYQVRGKTAYPLSLKDLTLAQHVTELLPLGLSSLKIEGRMKSPAYVYTVTRIWRTLLDERRNATPEEMKQLFDAFSRQGFTDGYFTGSFRTAPDAMSGVREEKAASPQESKGTFVPAPIPIRMHLELREGQPCRLEAFSSGFSAKAEGPVPDRALTRPLTSEALEKQLSKLGNTPFGHPQIQLDLDRNLILPLSALNDVRRKVCAELEEKIRASMTRPPLPSPGKSKDVAPRKDQSPARTGLFFSPEQITSKAASFFSLTFLPVSLYTGKADGFLLPPVLFDSETEQVKKQITAAIHAGARAVMISNIGQLPLAQSTGLPIYGSFRLNVTNRESASFWLGRGVSGLTLSPELTLPQCRDLANCGQTLVYGRIPLMVLERCIGRQVGSCEACSLQKNALVDRTGESFPVLRLPPHRNLLLNSRVLWTADIQKDLEAARIRHTQFLFSTETPAEVDSVIAAYEAHLSSSLPFRRIGVNLPPQKR
ncbi:MAG: U32 family peptidase [Clostridia bacterium]|nr:U32 family peptidase [Clostridia bacterium]